MLADILRHLPVLAVVFAAAVFASTAWAAGPSSPAAAKRLDDWTVIGMGGGGTHYFPTVSPLDPKKVFVRCDMTGEYISTDGGDSWRMFCLRTPARFFVWDPVDTNVAYAMSAGLYRTADNGKTWSLVHPAPAIVKDVVTSGDHAAPVLLTDGPDEHVVALAVDPADSRVLYSAMARDGEYFFMTSSDWGETWKAETPLPWGQAVRTLASGGRKIYVDPRSPKNDRTLYAIGDNQVSVRKGGKWTMYAPPKGVDAFVDSSAGFAKNGNLVVYAISSPEGVGRIVVSDDGGATWRDGGKSVLAWSGTTAAMPNLRSVGTCLTDPTVAYLSIDHLRVDHGDEFVYGIAKTTDTGRTWDLKIRETNPQASPRVKDTWANELYGPEWGENPVGIGVAPKDPNILYTTDIGRTMRSTDGLDTLEGVYSKRMPDGTFTTTGCDVTTCYGVHFDPFDPKHIIISYTDVGLWQSFDGGTTWINADVPNDWRNTTYWVVFDPEVKGRAWAVMTSVHDLPRPKMFRRDGTARYKGGVTVTADGGKTWTKSIEGMAPTAPTHIILDPKSPKDARVLYAAGFGTGVWKSIDGGKSWKLKNKGIVGDTPYAWRMTDDGKGTLYLLVARRSDDGSIGTDGDGAIYKSTDGAERWTMVNMPEGANAPNGLAIDPEDPKRMYLATWGLARPKGDVGGGIYLTTDGGKSWKNVESRHQHAYDITIDPKNPNVLYSCGFESSVLRSDDRGETWARIKGYNFKWGHRVVCDPRNADRIFVTTFGGSVWYGPATGDPKAVEDIVTPEASYR